MNEQTAPKLLLKLMAVITDRSREKRLTEIYRENHVELFFMFSAVGSANSDILDMFGLTGSEKIVALCVEPNFKASALMETVSERLEFRKPGNGIAFTVPLSGVSSPISNLFGDRLPELRERWEKEMDKELKRIGDESTHDLIVAVINQGFSDELIDAAKTAGAQGGTIIHARRVGEGEIVKFFGIPVQEEKEIVAILARREEKREIMRAITQSCGMGTKAKGIVISMHTDHVEGLRPAEEE